jgi:hypothetical protein
MKASASQCSYRAGCAAAPDRVEGAGPGPPGGRAGRGRHRRVETGGLARDRRAAADLGAWLCFEDESGQGPPDVRLRDTSSGRSAAAPILAICSCNTRAVAGPAPGLARSPHATFSWGTIASSRAREGRMSRWCSSMLTVTATRGQVRDVLTAPPRWFASRPGGAGVRWDCDEGLWSLGLRCAAPTPCAHDGEPQVPVGRQAHGRAALGRIR